MNAPQTEEDLLALFASKATAPPPEASRLLVSHLTCKESLHLSASVAQAVHRYRGSGEPQLAAPVELLPPLA
jgi:hypothetical protein